jgi:hypothetical protein
MHNLKYIWLTLFVLAISGIVLIMSAHQKNSTIIPQSTPSPASSDAETKTVGTLTCLPHKEKGDVHTMECVYGLRTDDQAHYALDTIFYPDPIDGFFNTGDRVVITGEIIGVDKLGESRLTIYDIKGGIRVLAIDKQ